MMLESVRKNDSANLYRLPARGELHSYIATAAPTRRICNDPTVAGVCYTRLLQQACTEIFKLEPFGLREREAVVVNILRGGLNFGLREALADAFNWNSHGTSFISAQRARDSRDPEAWHITENDYRKVYFPPVASLVIGDVVATGTSLRYGLRELLDSAVRQHIALKSVVFFTYGGSQAEVLLAEMDAECRKLFPNYAGTHLIYLEGCFKVASADTPLSVRLTGTDLLRFGAEMAPEFVLSQYEDPAYPLERCIIYDAGSRAFHLEEYVGDVIGYWKQNLAFAERGISFEALLRERFPELDIARYGVIDLKALALRQIEKMEHVLGK